jgi:DNA-binding sugar fermentation-stimulating protein
MKQKTANIKTATVVVMNTESQSYTMYDSALKTFLEGESRLDLLQDADRLEDFLLEIENFEVTHNQNDHIIISLSSN